MTTRIIYQSKNTDFYNKITDILKQTLIYILVNTSRNNMNP